MVVETKKLEKNQQIKQTMQATKARHKRMSCHVFELKVDRSHLSRVSLESLERLFHESRWFYNAILGSGNNFTFDDSVKTVSIKTPDGFEERELTLLSSQMKQGLLSRTKSAMRTLSTLMKKGKRVGRLKFKSVVSSIPLKQHGLTYRVVDSHHVQIQNLKASLRVHGLKQLQGMELANANLLQRAGDYYLMVTCFEEKPLLPESPLAVAGIDFNIEAGCQMVMDCGIAIGFDVQPPPSIKKLSQTLARQDRTNKAAGRKKHTHNRNQTKKRLQKAHKKATNIKTDIRRRVMHVLKTTFRVLCTQVENLKGWQKLWGKRILGTALAGIIAQLKTLPTTRFVARFVPTTSTCSRCHCRSERLPLDQKTFVCSHCGLVINRHVNAALNMVFDSGLEQAGEPVEKQTAVRLLWRELSKLPHVRVSLLR